MSKSYYAAANTGNGFNSLFDSIFSAEELSRLYIIKGGPGTGKSTFIRSIGDAAEMRGLEAEYYYCSADTDSLDGVKIPSLGVAVIDGTSPQSTDTRYPGACETIVNLCDNFDTEKLRQNRAEIAVLTNECSACYKRASRYLRAAGEAERMSLEVAARAFDTAKARAAAERLLGQIKPRGGAYSEKYISAIGAKGASHIENPIDKGEKRVCIKGKYGFDKLFLRVLCKCAEEGGYTVTRFPDVLLHDYTEAVYIAEAHTFYSVSDESQTEINAHRFVKNEVLCENRGKLRFAEKCRESLVEGAVLELREMGKNHDALEKYYVSAMDFSSSRVMQAKVENEIFGL